MFCYINDIRMDGVPPPVVAVPTADAPVASGSAWDATNHAAGVTLSNSNQTVTGSSGDLNRIGQSTLAITDGEQKRIEARMVNVGTLAGIGLGNADEVVTAGEHIGNQNGIGWVSDGRVFKFGIVVATYATFDDGDVLDLDVDQLNGGTVEFFKNGTSQGAPIEHGLGSDVWAVFNVKGPGDTVQLVQPGSFINAPFLDGWGEYGA